MRETEELLRPRRKRRRANTTRRVLIARFFLPGRVGTVRMRQKGVFAGWRPFGDADSSEEAADWCYYPDKKVEVSFEAFDGLVTVPPRVKGKDQLQHPSSYTFVGKGKVNVPGTTNGIRPLPPPHHHWHGIVIVVIPWL